MDKLFVREFVILLNEDEAVRSLALEAVSKQEIGPERARNNFRKLLKHFASDLKVMVVDNHHRALVRLIKTNLSNISQELFSEFSSDDQKAGDRMPECQKSVEEYLQISQHPEFVAQATPAHLNNSTLYDDAREQIELSESDEESDQDSTDEELEPDDALHSDLPEHLEEMRQFILQSTAYRTLRYRFDEFVRPSLLSKLGDLLERWSRHDHRHHSFVARYKLSNLVAELRNVHLQEIRLDEGNKSTRWQAVLGYYQNWIEQSSQTPWDWSPLPHCPRPLENGESL
ncbi:hypothetical protein THARTR1_06057 [Trichoderma harzianum]|uniref:Uncharacterized protein n=1 Tax=Trichoderma harzianum TaxID=5544 RepID=A0A2K0U6F4_TRIHA|nr:hypothetical protein THARTR1_06057 [Trichoderma harzianum]